MISHIGLRPFFSGGARGGERQSMNLHALGARRHREKGLFGRQLSQIRVHGLGRQNAADEVLHLLMTHSLKSMQ